MSCWVEQAERRHFEFGIPWLLEAFQRTATGSSQSLCAFALASLPWDVAPLMVSWFRSTLTSYFGLDRSEAGCFVWSPSS